MPKLPDFPRSLADTPILPSSLRGFGQDASSLAQGPMLDSLMLHRKLLSTKMGPGGLMGGPVAAGAGGALGGAPAPTQSLYEMAALTQEIDTQALTTKVKELLLANNLGQKVKSET